MKLKFFHSKTAGQHQAEKPAGEFQAHPVLEKIGCFYRIGLRYLALHYDEKRFLKLAHERVKEAEDLSEKLKPPAPGSDITLFTDYLSQLERIARNHMLAAQAHADALEVHKKINPGAILGKGRHENPEEDWTLAIFTFLEAIKQGKKIIEKLGNKGEPRAPMLQRVASLRASAAHCYHERNGVDDDASAAHQLQKAEEMRFEANQERKMSPQSV